MTKLAGIVARVYDFIPVGGHQLSKPLFLKTALTPAQIRKPTGAKNHLLASGKMRLELKCSLILNGLKSPLSLNGVPKSLDKSQVQSPLSLNGVYAQTPDDRSGVSAPFSLPGPEAEGPASQSLFRSYFQALGASWVQVTTPPLTLISAKLLINCFWHNEICYTNALLLLIWSSCAVIFITPHKCLVP